MTGIKEGPVMKEIKRKVIAILLTIFQIMSLISPVSTAVAAPGDDGGYNAGTFSYSVHINTSEASLTELAN